MFKLSNIVVLAILVADVSALVRAVGVQPAGALAAGAPIPQPAAANTLLPAALTNAPGINAPAALTAVLTGGAPGWQVAGAATAHGGFGISAGAFIPAALVQEK